MNRANTPHFLLSEVSSAATAGLLFVGRPFTVSGRPVWREGKEQKKSKRTETVGCNSALGSFLMLFALFVLLLASSSLSLFLFLSIGCIGMGAEPSVRHTRGIFSPLRDRLKDSKIEYLMMSGREN